MNNYSHSGDAGDLIAALAVVKHLGGGHLTLYPSAATGHRMTPERADSLGSLLRLQPYLASVEWAPEPKPINLDGWRGHYKSGRNLTDILADWLGVAHPPRHEPWIQVDAPKQVAQVVMHRSPRYHGRFPWGVAVRKYAKIGVFVGAPDEHMAFVADFGEVPYYATSNYLELARVIAGAYLYLGNQSSPFWIAESLKVPCCVEEVDNPRNCHWQRPGHLAINDEWACLPDPEDLHLRWEATRPPLPQ